MFEALEINEKMRSLELAIHARLNDEGRLIITVPTSNVPVAPKHFQHFTLESLQRALEPFFVVEKYEFLNRRSRGNRMIARLLANRLFILNEPRLRFALLRRYEKRYLLAAADTGVSVFAKCRKVRLSGSANA